jgi:hypothetical protein
VAVAVRDEERLVRQGHRADQRVVVQVDAADAPGHRVGGPQAYEIGAFDGQAAFLRISTGMRPDDPRRDWLVEHRSQLRGGPGLPPWGPRRCP